MPASEEEREVEGTHFFYEYFSLRAFSSFFISQLFQPIQLFYHVLLRSGRGVLYFFPLNRICTQIIKIFLEHSSHFKKATVYRTVSFILFFRTRQEPGLLSRVSVWQEGKKENKTKAGIERCFLPKKRISLSNIRPRGAEQVCH